ncbi:Uncharacterized protein PRO82_001397 [Candidatus Protochlamydia amoebophila]|uniref:hypothetical protein n=1 Tax=Candidatus Protochlamydia amoebophila TaxID=362787 RepID=UPI001BC9816D|nr:hypothetical protein [Candidatus Protochlamydia amoebophila]MBS4164081.1 Uncharacterized protein [Candidatus Protochlamydia amoebophila]
MIEFTRVYKLKTKFDLLSQKQVLEILKLALNKNSTAVFEIDCSLHKFKYTTPNEALSFI